MDENHQHHNHPRATPLQSIIQPQYWIASSRQVIKSRLQNCIACYRLQPHGIQLIMGNLLKFRLQQVKPFMILGVDYAGPIPLKTCDMQDFLQFTKYHVAFQFVHCTTIWRFMGGWSEIRKNVTLPIYRSPSAQL